MRRTFVALIAAFAFAAPAVASAQNAPRPAGTPSPAGNGEIRGTVVDMKDSTPMARASVAIRNKRDSALVAGAIATSAGAFRVQGLRAGAYIVRITALGYTPRVQAVTITEAVPLANLGVIRVGRFAVALNAVEITEDRATMAIEPDRNSYTTKSVAPAATNASEVLEAVPSVSVDQDGKVSLRGNENVAIQINGRPSPITGTQLAAYLKSLPANILDRVEVVPNPSAKYDPEGMAG
ncbi:MAG: TonB-dependent receptor, partial [bacterium]